MKLAMMMTLNTDNTGDDDVDPTCDAGYTSISLMMSLGMPMSLTMMTMMAMTTVTTVTMVTTTVTTMGR